MSKVSNFAYTNVTPGDHPVTPYELGLTTLYTKDVSNADLCVLENLTTPTDAAERIAYRSKLIPQVNHNLNIQYPGPVKKGVTYTIEVQETLSTTDTEHADYRVDDPIVMYLTVRHSRSGVITEAKIAEVFRRLCSAIYKEDGTTRFGDLMRGSETPVVD
jgi:hypothetical protein